MVLDYIIVGQGIAGTALGYTMIKQGLNVLILDDESSSSSKVAAGLFNPITGSKGKMVKTWKAEELFPFLSNFYTHMEKDFNSKFFFPLPIFRPFASEEEQGQWVNNTDNSYEQFSRVVTSSGEFPINKSKHFGGLTIFNGGYIDTKTMLSSAFNFFESRSSIKRLKLNYIDLAFDDDHVKWGEFKAKKIIFAEGHLGRFNPYFNWVPFAPVKGEVLTVRSEYPLNLILNKSVFVVPLQKRGEMKAGATYDWKSLDETISDKAKNEIENKLGKLVNFDFEFVKQEAGIRPSIRDRRPVLGIHPLYPSLVIFNGLGTKGVSLAPYFADQLFSFLEENKSLDNEVNIARFESFFIASKVL